MDQNSLILASAPHGRFVVSCLGAMLGALLALAIRRTKWRDNFATSLGVAVVASIIVGQALPIVGIRDLQGSPTFFIGVVLGFLLRTKPIGTPSSRMQAQREFVLTLFGGPIVGLAGFIATYLTDRDAQLDPISYLVIFLSISTIAGVLVSIAVYFAKLLPPSTNPNDGASTTPQIPHP